MQDKYLTKDQMQTILDSRPKGVSMDDALNMYVKNGWTIQGVNEKPAAPAEPTLGSKLLDTGKQVMSDIKGTVNRVTSGETSPLSGTVQLAGNVAKGGLDAVGNVITSTPVVKDIVQAVAAPISTGVKATQDWISNNPHIQAAVSNETSNAIADFLDKHPDIARNADAVNNIANAILIAKGGVETAGKATTLVKNGLVSAKDTTASMSSGIDSTIGKVNTIIKPTPVQAIANTEKGIMDIVDNSKSLVKDFAKREGTGKNPVKMIAENPDYSVKVNPESKTIDAADAITNMKRDIASFSQVRDSLLKVADETLPPIKTNYILNKTLNVFSNKSYATYLDEGEKAVASIVKKLKTLQKYNPETVSRTTLNDIRKGLDDTINSFTNTKLQDKVRLDLRKVFQTTLEDSIPESGLLKNLNAQIGDIIDAHDFTVNKLNGTKVKGGGLTDLAMKTAGASTGAVLGGSLLGGIPGAIGGYIVSNFLSKQLIKNAINNPFDRGVLENLKQTVPDIVKQAEEYIANSRKSKSKLLK